MKHSAISDGSATVFNADGEATASAAFEHVYAVPEGATHAVVMMEAPTGDADLDVRLEPLSIEARDELSRLARVKLRFLALAQGTEELAIRIISAGKAAVRVTVAFFKREAGALRKNFSCKTCKQLCKLALSAVLAHLGVPYLDAEAATDLPGIAPIDDSPEAATALRALAAEMDLTPEDLQAPIPVQTGEPVPVTQACIDLLDTPAEAPEWIRVLFDFVHPKAMAAVRVALEIVDGYIDATDRIYTFACESIGMCKPASGKPSAGAA
ncbi:hypothetical protein O4H66_13045 [Comamonadaceae bacterium G21597-S1]|nr:hypothetical protein [Comamonadaceae bacterium G21597-S1]